MKNQDEKLTPQNYFSFFSIKIQALLLSLFIKTKRYQKQKRLKKSEIFYQTDKMVHLENSKDFFIHDITQTNQTCLVVDEIGVLGILYIEISVLKELDLHVQNGDLIQITNPILVFQYANKLPIFIVENSNGIQVSKLRIQKQFPSQKYRQLAKSLIKTSMHKSQIIYKYLLQKDASQKQVLYSNLGFIHEKNGDLTNAKRLYKKSLSIKKYQKSLLRLTNLYLSQENFKQAKQMIKQIQDKVDKSNMESLYLKKFKQVTGREKTFTQQNFIKINVHNNVFLKKKKVKFQKIIQNTYSLDLNPSAKYQLSDQVIEFLSKGEIYTLLCSYLQFEKLPSNFIFMKQITKVYLYADLPVQRQNYNKFKIFMGFAKLLLSYYSEYHAMSICYYIYFQNYFLNLPWDKQIIRFLMNLSQRCTYVQKSLQNKCLQLQRYCDYQEEVLEICGCIDKSSLIFALKKCEILQQLQKYSQHLKYTEEMFQQIFYKRNFKGFTIYFANQHLKSLMRFQKYNQSIVWGKRVLSKLEIMEKIPIYTLNKDYMKQITEIYKKISPSHIESQAYFKNNLSLCYMKLQLPEYSLQIINQNLQNTQFILGEQFYFSTVLMKIKVMRKLYQKDKDYTIRYIGEVYQYFQKQKETENLKFFKCILMKYILEYRIDEKCQIKIAKCAEQICRLQPKFEGFIISKISKFILQNQQHALSLIKKLKSFQHLRFVYQQIRQHYQDHVKKLFDSYLPAFQYFNFISFEQPNQNIHEPQLQKTSLSTQADSEISTKIQQQQSNSMLQIQKQQLEDTEQISENQSQEENQQQCEQIQQNEAYFEENVEFNKEIKEKFKDYSWITSIKKKMANQNFYIYFSKKIKFEKFQENQFIIAASKISKRDSNGIKFMKDGSLRLKIKGGARLTGKMLNTNDLLFTTLEKHDDYLRK